MKKQNHQSNGKPVTGGRAYWCAECRKRATTWKDLVWVEKKGYCHGCAEHRIEQEVWKLRVTSDEDIEQRKPAPREKTAEDHVREIEPDAYIMVSRSIRTVVRPRRPTDLPAIVPYVLLGGDEYTSEMAWKSALKRLNMIPD